MRNIVLVGEFNSITQNLYQLLGSDYYIQLGSADAVCLRGILEIARVQLILMVTTGLEPEHEDLFKVIEEVCPELPMVCIGTKGETDIFDDYLQREKITVLYRPIQIKKIKEHIAKSIGLVIGEAENREGNWVKKYGKRKIKKILLVDDSQVQLHMLKNLLNRKYEICMAESGQEALRVLPQFMPDLIFLDYNMPEFDGKETLKKIREEGYGDIPVVFLTGVNDRKHIQSVLELNPAKYLLKPVEQDKLYKIIEELSSDNENS